MISAIFLAAFCCLARFVTFSRLTARRALAQCVVLQRLKPGVDAKLKACGT